MATMNEAHGGERSLKARTINTPNTRNNIMMNNHELNEIARDYAKEIRREVKAYNANEYELACQYADGSEHVIYYSKAHDVCQSCDITSGEVYVEEMEYDSASMGYDTYATILVYGELLTRIQVALHDLEAGVVK
tara:strand:- start:602 stop:1006 length:405 start_codon:yes stop_codon:yes gene_type:complete